MAAQDFVITDGTAAPIMVEVQNVGAAPDYRWLSDPTKFPFDKFDYFEIRGSAVIPSQIASLLLQFTGDGGLTWGAVGSYRWQLTGQATGGAQQHDSSASDNGIRISGNAAKAPGTSFRIELDNLKSAAPLAVMFREIHFDGATDYAIFGSGYYRGGPVNGIRLVPRAGTILSGQATLKGIIG